MFFAINGNFFFLLYPSLFVVILSLPVIIKSLCNHYDVFNCHLHSLYLHYSRYCVIYRLYGHCTIVTNRYGFKIKISMMKFFCIIRHYSSLYCHYQSLYRYENFCSTVICKRLLVIMGSFESLMLRLTQRRFKDALTTDNDSLTTNNDGITTNNDC